MEPYSTALGLRSPRGAAPRSAGARGAETILAAALLSDSFELWLKFGRFKKLDGVPMGNP